MIKRLREKNHRKAARDRRARAKVSGTLECPRLTVFRSLKSISVQAVDDETGKTLAAADLRELGGTLGNTVPGAKAVGMLIAEKCLKIGVKQAVFDRGSSCITERCRHWRMVLVKAAWCSKECRK
jgi:large subunit ribosomal protein L18